VERKGERWARGCIFFSGTEGKLQRFRKSRMPGGDFWQGGTGSLVQGQVFERPYKSLRGQLNAYARVELDRWIGKQSRNRKASQTWGAVRRKGSLRQPKSSRQAVKAKRKIPRKK